MHATAGADATVYVRFCFANIWQHSAPTVTGFFVDIQIFKYLKKYSKIVRCDGSLMAHQTSGAEVPGSNPASLTIMWKFSGKKGKFTPEAKKIEKIL